MTKKKKAAPKLDKLDEEYVEDIMRIYGMTREDAIKSLECLRIYGI